MKYKYALIFENGDSIKKIEKSTNAILRNNYESITWLKENDARVKKLINNGYWIKKQLYVLTKKTKKVWQQQNLQQFM